MHTAQNDTERARDVWDVRKEERGDETTHFVPFPSLLFAAPTTHPNPSSSFVRSFSFRMHVCFSHRTQPITKTKKPKKKKERKLILFVFLFILCIRTTYFFRACVCLCDSLTVFISHTQSAHSGVCCVRVLTQFILSLVPPSLSLLSFLCLSDYLTF